MTAETILANNEPLLPLMEAVKPYDLPHLATALRWCTRGLAAKDGSRIYLEHVRVGIKTKTSAEAVKRFFAALSANARAENAPK